MRVKLRITAKDTEFQQEWKDHWLYIKSKQNKTIVIDNAKRVKKTDLSEERKFFSGFAGRGNECQVAFLLTTSKTVGHKKKIKKLTLRETKL